MIALSQPSRRGAESDLVQVIEPLASYICAASRPRAALASALALLFSQVEETNRTASMHVASFFQNHGA